MGWRKDIKRALGAIVLLIISEPLGCKLVEISSSLWILPALVMSLSSWYLVLLIVVYIKKLWSYSHPTSILIGIFIFLLGIILIELHLRKAGIVPGILVPTDLHLKIIPENELEVRADMICDSFGVNRFNPNSVARVAQGINGEGFQSPYEFQQPIIDSLKQAGEKVLFLIGDSYTYGLSADSGYSFASLIDKTSEFAVLNAGIPGGDFVQYKAVVNEYILFRGLKPDAVVVCVNGANDVGHSHERKLTPGIPLLYNTNVGSIYTFRGGDTTFQSAKAAYLDFLKNYTVRGVIGENQLSYLVEKSVVISLMAGEIYRSTIFSSLALRVFKKAYFQNVIENTDNNNVDLTNQEINQIKNDCNAAGVPVVFIMLPGKAYIRQGSSPQYLNMISLNPQELTLSDYTSGSDDHPNNSGHQKLANQILRVMSEIEYER